MASKPNVEAEFFLSIVTSLDILGQIGTDKVDFLASQRGLHFVTGGLRTSR